VLSDEAICGICIRYTTIETKEPVPDYSNPLPVCPAITLVNGWIHGMK
jgi:hypothetical protein